MFTVEIHSIIYGFIFSKVLTNVHWFKPLGNWANDDTYLCLRVATTVTLGKNTRIFDQISLMCPT